VAKEVKTYPMTIRGDDQC